MSTPTDEQLAADPQLRWTLHTRWETQVWAGDGPAPACMCDWCRQLRRDRWEEEHR